MLFLLSASAAAAETGGHAAPAGEHAAAGGHHTPALVEFVNHYVGPPLHDFQIHYTKPLWDRLFARFGTTAESVFGAYTPENAVPWPTVMFVLAALLVLLLVWMLKPRKLSVEEPEGGQMTIETGVLAIRDLLADNVGPQGRKYLPVVATFGILILVSNLMGLVPGLMSPTASTNVTFALGISSFVYYNAIGIRENGLFGHLRHFAGPVIWLAPLMFPIELISNLVRPMSLGVRLFGNLFGDEQILGTISGLVKWIVPVLIMPLSVFVAFMQTFIFVLLSILYISEVSHHHDEHVAHEGHGHDPGEHVGELKVEAGGVMTLPSQT